VGCFFDIINPPLCKKTVYVGEKGLNGNYDFLAFIKKIGKVPSATSKMRNFFLLYTVLTVHFGNGNGH
jgi:hypothetical protein